VYLPALEGTPVAARTSAPTSIERGSELILLVEDEDLLRAMVSRMLRKLGYEVLEASNGPEAIRIFEQETRQIDLLLTDMVMPQGISGTDLGLRLRERRKDLEVLIMSGYSVELTGEGGTLPIGMRFLSKPFTTKLLSDAVQQALAAIRGSRAST
jgi:CheY-like chemotaxis protein